VQLLRKILRIFSLNGRLFQTILPGTDPSRAAAQDELWSRLYVKANEVKHGPAQVQPLAEWVRGIGTADKLDLLVQQSIGILGGGLHEEVYRARGAHAGPDRREVARQVNR
jgi:hypothetical protein